MLPRLGYPGRYPSTKIQMRFSIATILFVVFLVSAYFPIRGAFNTWQERRLADQYPDYLHSVCMSELCEGDSLSTVAGKLESLSLVQPISFQRKEYERVLSRLKIPYDEKTCFYTYQLHGVKGMLRFRDGKLLGHIYPNVHDPIAATKRLSKPIPSLWMRLGVLPLYLVIATVVLCGWIWWGRTLHRRG